MHVVLSWDIKAEGPAWDELNEQLRNCLSTYDWVKPLTTFYVVEVLDAEDRQDLKDQLVSVCSANPGKINLIISPLMSGGTYGGWLPKSLWPQIRERTS